MSGEPKRTSCSARMNPVKTLPSRMSCDASSWSSSEGEPGAPDLLSSGLDRVPSPSAAAAAAAAAAFFLLRFLREIGRAQRKAT